MTETRMSRRALEIAKKKIRGGPDDPVFQHEFLDAAFSSNIFFWDSCMIAGWAKYYIAELPVYAMLDNFYMLQDEDGFICREYSARGKALWSKHHPISTNPPILAWAELQLFSQSGDVERLKRVYAPLRNHYQFIQANLRGEDGLYFCDAFGAGMDNLPRSPRGWTPDNTGIPMQYVDGNVFRDFIEPYNIPYVSWNKQGRMVDISSQMALFALNLVEIAKRIGAEADVAEYLGEHATIKELLNERCWDEEAGFYFDLGFGKRIARYHIGCFWPMIAGITSQEQAARMAAHLQDPMKFATPTPVASLAADEPEYCPWGEYWRGGVWAPTNYMILLGLDANGFREVAQDIACRYYRAVERVFEITNNFWENYAPGFDSYGAPALPDFCGWTGLAPIAVYREFIL